MTDSDEIFEERRRREVELREADRQARLLRDQEERERRARTPLDVGNGRILRQS